MEKKLDIETFIKEIDEFLEENHIQMLIDMPEGTLDPKLEDNANLGGTVQFFILLKALPEAYMNMIRPMLFPDKEEFFIDGILEMVKEEMLQKKEERDGTF